MAESPHSPDAGLRPGRGSRTRTPRWVKAFGIIALVLLLLAVLKLTGVLGEGHGPGRHLGGARRDTGSSIGVGGPAGAGAAARTIEVAALDTMAFRPAGITVSAGESVTFVVSNAGRAVHEFTLGNAAMQQQHAEVMGHIPAGMGHDMPNSITLRPGETKRLTWRFGSAGTIEYACHQPGHYGAGMRGRITIT